MRLSTLLLAFIVASQTVAIPAATLDLSTSKLSIDDRGVVSGLTFGDGVRWPASSRPAFTIERDGRGYLPQSLEITGDRWSLRFEDHVTADFRVTTGRGFAVFRLVRLEPRGGITRLRLFSLAVPSDARITGTLNGGSKGGRFAAVMAAEPNVFASHSQIGVHQADRSGCRHTLVCCDESKVGRHAARFTATCNQAGGGWSMCGKDFAHPLDLTGCKAIRAWVHGDGNRQALKIQLYDGAGGYRDNYLPIDFHGWRRVTLTECPINTLRYDHVASLNFYYNGMPANKTVTCLIGQVEAVIERGGRERVEVLEDFEAADSPLWSNPVVSLFAETSTKHGIQPAAFGVIACPEAERFDTIARFEVAAGLPSPRPGGVWNKRSPWVKQSYFFLTNFRQSQFDQALAIARRGGFSTILLGQESWSLGTGHYEINRDRFPDGLDGLKRTLGRFKQAGFRVGLHFLGASIYPPDPYITPVPDRRLVTGAAAALAADIDQHAALLPLDISPEKFPAEDGGYMGTGRVVRVGDELIAYGGRSLAAPFGLTHCRRGYLGTKPSAHQKGDRVLHLVRSYGYYMHDMDTSLTDEVAGHFAKVANACGIDMIYFDGSEALQGDHWYYNARLLKAFYDKLENKNMLLQASSYSHYSWHLLARSASADGHGDLKGYLDERSAGFDPMRRNGMPFDIGWYYGYDPNATPDEYEYILGATIGYDSSMSFQVSCEAAARQPFTGQVLDLIARYEKLRLSGRVPPAMRERLRIDPALAGKKTPEERAKLLARRREYRLLGPEGKQYFQRVVYGPWHEVESADPQAATWSVRAPESPSRVGVQIHARGAPAKGTRDAQTLADPFVEIDGRRWQWKGELAAGQYVFFWPGEAVTRYGLPLKQPERSSEEAAAVTLSAGEHSVRFGCRGAMRLPTRVRVTFQPAERHEIP